MTKTYQAPTMAQALAEVKRDLGREAVILHTRSYRKGGLMGILGGTPMWEITASSSLNVPRRLHRTFASAAEAMLRQTPEQSATLTMERPGPDDQPGHQEEATEEQYETDSDELPLVSQQPWPSQEVREAAWRRQVGLDRSRPKAKSVTPAPTDDAPHKQAPQEAKPATAASFVVDQALSREVGEIKKMVKALIHVAPTAAAMRSAAARDSAWAPTPASGGVSDDLREFHAQLLRQDVEESISRQLMEQLRLSLSGVEKADSKMIADRLCDLIASRIHTAEPVGRKPSQANKPRVIALIGPTGVGKTTTIAKLAADFKLRHNKRVGLVTIDTYRIAAVDQLRTYGEIIEVPVRTVLSAGELHGAVYGMSDVDIVLIDTAGRSQNDSPRLNQLGSFLATVEADEVHLVISATATRRCAKTIINRFGPLGINRILLTKLDEAESFGTILSLSAGGVPLSYVTTGQDVPDDFELADPWRLAQMVMKGPEHAS